MFSCVWVTSPTTVRKAAHRQPIQDHQSLIASTTSMGCNWSSLTFAQQMSLAATNQKAIVLSWWGRSTKITANASNHRKRLFIVLKLVSCDLQGFVTFCYTATFICLYLPKKGTVAKVHVMHLESCPVRRSKEEKVSLRNREAVSHPTSSPYRFPHTIQMYIV